GRARALAGSPPAGGAGEGGAPAGGGGGRSCCAPPSLDPPPGGGRTGGGGPPPPGRPPPPAATRPVTRAALGNGPESDQGESKRRGRRKGGQSLLGELAGSVVGRRSAQIQINPA